jgi:adenylate cyclase class 2
MNYEVEQKFPVDDFSALEAKLAELGAAVSEPRCEVDLYFAHPARDFASTDEALRIRRVGRSLSITYKGPKIDATTKTRREIELPLSPHDEAAAGWEDLLQALGFQPVAEVRKRRRRATVPWQGRRITATLDDVDQVGTYVELELVADDRDLEPAKACIASLAAALGLSGGERRSYLELLLDRRPR